MDTWTSLDFLVAGASIATILGAVFVIARWGGAIMAALRRRFARFQPKIPRETMRAVPERKAWWHMGAQGRQPAMQIMTYWLVTNVCDRPALVNKAYMSRGWFRAVHEADHIFGDPIPERATVEIMIDFWVRPPFRKKGESFKARLTLVDHLGNRHRTARITIPSDWRPPKPEKPKPIEEAMHAISDPLIKRVVATIKDEVSRYKECGRPVGGLGSVQITHEGRTLPGIGYQGRKSNSPARQWIVPDPENAAFQSDNLEALMRIFDGQDEAGKRLIINALLQRITLGSEYTSVGYFLLLVLFRMGQLPAALRKIKAELIDDDEYGFDDAVRMLSGLLQYEYTGFDDALLDEVELFVDGLKGHTHLLKERCVAARAVERRA